MKISNIDTNIVRLAGKTDWNKTKSTTSFEKILHYLDFKVIHVISGRDDNKMDGQLHKNYIVKYNKQIYVIEVNSNHYKSDYDKCYDVIVNSNVTKIEVE